MGGSDGTEVCSLCEVRPVRGKHGKRWKDAEAAGICSTVLYCTERAERHSAAPAPTASEEKHLGRVCVVCATARSTTLENRKRLPVSLFFFGRSAIFIHRSTWLGWSSPHIPPANCDFSSQTARGSSQIRLARCFCCSHPHGLEKRAHVWRVTFCLWLSREPKWQRRATTLFEVGPWIKKLT